MKKAKTDVHNRVINYLKENLSRCDLNNVEVYVGGDPSVGDGHLYLVLAKDKKSRSNKEDTYSCWTCWNDKTESLNFGHYDLSKEDAMYTLMEYDPVDLLMKYVPANKSQEILEDYNYKVTKGTKTQYQEILKDFNNIERDF